MKAIEPMRQVLRTGASPTRPRIAGSAPRYAAWLILLALLCPTLAAAQWAAQPGEVVRNAFGPADGSAARVCRGACGLDCPSTCSRRVEFECAEGDRLRRVRAYSCGTHQGCREHDDCLDRCSQQHAQGYDCATECHAKAVEGFGMELAGPWALGGGPFDGEIVYEYTRDAPGAPEAAYRCPAGAERVCNADGAACVADGAPVPPVFERYPDAGAGTLQVSDFRSGRVCVENGEPESVCDIAVDIDITGDARCADGTTPCTWYGFELAYDNADPSAPLECTSTGAEEDFLGTIVTRAIEAVPAQQGTQLGDLLGHLQKELKSGSSLADVLSGISVTPAGGSGQVLGGQPAGQPALKPGVPRSVPLAASSGRLLVPMYEVMNGARTDPLLVRDVRCTHKGQPVLETSFRLHFNAG